MRVIYLLQKKAPLLGPFKRGCWQENQEWRTEALLLLKEQLGSMGREHRKRIELIDVRPLFMLGKVHLPRQIADLTAGIPALCYVID